MPPFLLAPRVNVDVCLATNDSFLVVIVIVSIYSAAILTVSNSMSQSLQVVFLTLLLYWNFLPISFTFPYCKWLIQALIFSILIHTQNAKSITLLDLLLHFPVARVLLNWTDLEVLGIFLQCLLILVLDFFFLQKNVFMHIMSKKSKGYSLCL